MSYAGNFFLHGKCHLKKLYKTPLKNPIYFAIWSKTEQNKPSCQCLFRLLLLFQLWNIRVKFTSLNFSSLVCSVTLKLVVLVYGAACWVFSTIARGLRCGGNMPARDWVQLLTGCTGPVLCAPAHSWLGCCMRRGIFLFFKLWTLALLASIHEASLGKPFLRTGTHISGSGPGQPWRVNEEKQDSSMKEGNKPEGLSRWKVFKSLWVYDLS